MKGAIFTETLRRDWRQALYWGLGLGSLGLYVCLMINDVEMLQQYADLMGSLPPAMIQMLGISEASAIATPEGFLSFSFFSYSLLMLAVFAVGAGMEITANEEEDGILDVMLSLPVSRAQLMLEKYAAFAVIAIIIILLAFVGLLIGLQISQIPVNGARLVESTFNMLPTLLFMIAFTMFIAVLVRRKSLALVISAAFIIASYFINTLGGMASGTADTLQAISFFNYYDSEGVMLNGLNIGNALLLIGLTAALTVGALWLFDRRDVGV